MKRGEILPIDVADIDIEHLDVDLVSRTQIVEFISRNEVALARLVEVILIVQGFRVQASPFGKYGGVSMIAEGGEGPIGFRLPRIAVLVNPGSEIADPDINELEELSALSGAAQGLFVSWAGFSKAARAEAGRLFHQAKYWDIGQTVAEWTAVFEKLPHGVRSILPLKQIWILDQTPTDRSSRFLWQDGDLEHHGVKHE